MSEETTLLDAVTVLIERGVYKDRDALMQDALRALLRSKPELRGQLAVALYQRGDVSLTRAAEISGLDLESCKELLREAGVVRGIPPAGQAIRSRLAYLHPGFYQGAPTFFQKEWIALGAGNQQGLE